MLLPEAQANRSADVSWAVGLPGSTPCHLPLGTPDHSPDEESESSVLNSFLSATARRRAIQLRGQQHRFSKYRVGARADKAGLGDGLSWDSRPSAISNPDDIGVPCYGFIGHCLPNGLNAPIRC
ncbi:hypothetical protein SH139x_004443 [Planctomycetaceae bacterium SH139]